MKATQLQSKRDRKVLRVVSDVFGEEQWKELDDGVADYLVYLIGQIGKQGVTQKGVATASQDDVEEVTSVFLENNLCADKAAGKELCLRIFAELRIMVSENKVNDSTTLRTSEQPIGTDSESEEKPTYLTCDLKEKGAFNPVEDFLANTRSEDPKVRKLYLRELCPCHVKRDVDVVWDRIIDMVDDPSPDVRYQVMHNLCDGSPASRESEVVAALEKMHNDPDKKVRRRVHNVLTHYRKTGKWNIL